MEWVNAASFPQGVALEEELPVHLSPLLLQGRFNERSGVVSPTDEDEGETVPSWCLAGRGSKYGGGGTH